MIHASRLEEDEAEEMEEEEEEAVYTTASVAYGCAGALMQVRSLFGLNPHCVTDGPTDGRWTDRQTDLYSRVYD